MSKNTLVQGDFCPRCELTNLRLLTFSILEETATCRINPTNGALFAQFYPAKIILIADHQGFGKTEGSRACTVAAKKNATFHFANISSTEYQIFMKVET